MIRLAHRFVKLLLLAALPTLFAGQTQAQQGPPSNLIYAHDRLYTGVNQPGDLPNTGKFDAIFALGAGLQAVAESAPGDRDYNGGRWEVYLVTFLSIAPRQFTNAEQIRAAAGAGEIQISGIVRRFECPLIPIRD